LASCGDYVHLGDKAHAAPMAEHPANLPSSAPVSLPSGQSKPCRGPHCSQQPVAPPAPATPVPVRSQEWGTAITLASPAAADFLGFLTDIESAHPDRRTLAIFHPPRDNSSW